MKTFFYLPAILLMMLTIPVEHAVAGDKKKVEGNTIVYNGNIFEAENLHSDTAIMLDLETGELYSEITNATPVLLKMNGISIHDSKDVDHPSSLTSQSLKRYILINTEHILRKLGDGEYRIKIDNVIIDDKGRIVYYDYNGIEKHVLVKSGNEYDMSYSFGKSNNSGTKVSGKWEWQNTGAQISKQLEEQIELLINKAPKYKPAANTGTVVICRIDNHAFKESFKIKQGQVFYFR